MCDECDSPITDDKFCDAWWEVRRRVKKHVLHNSCVVKASRRTTFTLTKPGKPLRPDHWNKIEATHRETKDMRLKAERKPRKYFYFSREKVGGFIAGKLTAAMMSAEREGFKAQPNITIESRVAASGNDGKPRWVEIETVCTDNNVWRDIKDFITSRPGKPSIIGQCICIVCHKLTDDERYAEISVFVEPTLDKLLAEVNASEEMEFMRGIHGSDFKVDCQLWYEGLDTELAKIPGITGDPIPF